MAPVLLFLGFNGLFEFFKYINFNTQIRNIITVIFVLVLLVLNSTYMSYKENNILLLNKELMAYNEYKIFRSNRANNYINQWVVFTEYPNLSKALGNSANQTDLDSLQTNDLLITRAYKKFGHVHRTNKIENSVQLVLGRRKTKKIIEVDGYTVYLIMD